MKDLTEKSLEEAIVEIKAIAKERGELLTIQPTRVGAAVPILTLDFDGVIHSYKSGWKGAAVIPDDPVPGALEFIVKALDHFIVVIHSSRSHQWGGRRAMKRWLKRHLIAAAGSDWSDTPEWWQWRISKTAFADPWKDEVEWAAECVIKEIQWPLFKPPSHVSIDDRALTFNGHWPSIDQLRRFRPWNKR